MGNIYLKEPSHMGNIYLKESSHKDNIYVKESFYLQSAKNLPLINQGWVERWLPS